jgi:uncharacterized protein DUF3152
MTTDRPDDVVRGDVARARDGVRNAGVTYGPRMRRRSFGDVWRDFAHRYGWRAYALPALVILTAAALMTTTEVAKRTADNTAAQQAGAGKQDANAAAPPPVASGSIALKDDDASSSGDVNNDVLKAAALPAGASYTTQGNGSFRILKGTSPKVGHGRLFRYSIDVENGITGVDLKQFQHVVVQTLSDPRSWSGHGVALQRVDSGPIDFHATWTSAMTVRQFCGYTIKVETSCYAPAGGASDANRVIFNVARWVRGSAAYVGDLAAYRVYMVNHEDGHAIGHQHAHQCLPGGLAPVMMQQTFGLKSATSGKMCGANPWPYPPAAKGVPGAEQPDTPQNNEYGLAD